MNEEKRPNFPDKYHLSRKESVYLLKKNIVELVYNAGKFEGLNTTLLQTEEIIKYNRANNVAVVCGKIDVHTIAAQKYITPQAA